MGRLAAAALSSRDNAAADQVGMSVLVGIGRKHDGHVAVRRGMRDLVFLGLLVVFVGIMILGFQRRYDEIAPLGVIGGSGTFVGAFADADPLVQPLPPRNTSLDRLIIRGIAPI
jgi:hypothetical protein